MRALAVFVVLAAATAHATDLSLVVVGEAACPARDRVVAALAQLAPSAHLVQPAQARLAVTLTDLGTSWTIETTTQKTVDDPLRRCDERARAAALVIALALDELPPPLLPPLVAAPPPLAPPTRPRLVPVIDRPLVLGFSHVEAKEEVTFGSATRSAYGFTSVTDVEGGVGRRVMVGGFVALPIVEDSSDVTVVPRVTIGLTPHVALRLELGFVRQYTIDESGHGGALDGGFAALALLTRVRVHRRVLLTLGETGPRTQWPVGLGHYSNSPLAGTSSSLLAVSMNAAVLMVTVTMPIAVVFQLHERVALRVATGVQVELDYANAYSPALRFPTSLDLVVSPSRFIDLGATYGMPLATSAPGTYYEAALFVRSRI